MLLQVLMVAWDVLASHEAMAAWHAGRLAAHAVDLATLRALRAGQHARLQADPDVSPEAHPPGPGEAGAAAAAAPAPAAEAAGDARQVQAAQGLRNPQEGPATAGTERVQTPEPSGPCQGQRRGGRAARTAGSRLGSARARWRPAQRHAAREDAGARPESSAAGRAWAASSGGGGGSRAGRPPCGRAGGAPGACAPASRRASSPARHTEQLLGSSNHHMQIPHAQMKQDVGLMACHVRAQRKVMGRRCIWWCRPGGAPCSETSPSNLTCRAPAA